MDDMEGTSDAGGRAAEPGPGAGAASDTAALFDAIARGYDHWSSLLSAAGIKVWHQVAVDHLAIRPTDQVLDVGCGTGTATAAMAERVGGTGRVVGLDPSESMLAVARQRWGSLPIDWVRGVAEALPFSDASFDRVTAQFSLRNTRRWRQALAEMVRVLKPGGRLVLLDLVQPVTALGAVAWKGLQKAVAALPAIASPNLEPYEWLAVSLRHAPTAGEIVAVLRRLGLEDIRERYWLGDLVAIIEATAPRQAAPTTTEEAEPAPAVVVWGVDGSLAALEGQRWLAGHLAPGAQVHLVAVTRGGALPESVAATEYAAACQHLKEAAAGLLDRFQVTQAVLQGEPAAEIVAYAQRVGAHTIVLGRKHRSALADRALGGVVREVMRTAACSVVLLPPIGR